MKMRVTVTLILLCAAAAMARAGSDEGAGVSPRGVTVLRFDWYENTRRSDWDKYGAVDASQNGTVAPPMTTPAGQARVGTEVSSGRRHGSGNADVSQRVTRADDPGAPPSTPSEMPVTSPPLMRGKGVEYVYRVKLRNDGEKAISGVDWEYQFLDPDTGQEIAHHRFESLGGVKPGKSRTLESASVAPPAKVVSAAALGRGGKARYKERVVIRCVAYSDGSVSWHDSGDQDDCARLKRLAQARRD
jgi:hypothetical protein